MLNMKYRLCEKNGDMLLPVGADPIARIKEVGGLLGFPVKPMIDFEAKPSYFWCGANESNALHYDLGEDRARVRVGDIERGGRFQRARWSSLLLYAECFTSYPDKITLHLDNETCLGENAFELIVENWEGSGNGNVEGPLPVNELMSMARPELFQGEEGEIALAGIFGARSYTMFLSVWQAALKQPEPIESARFLLDNYNTF